MKLTDQEHAHKIKTLVAQLNDAISAASDAGLTVECDISLRYGAISTPERTMLRCRITREIAHV